MEEKEEQINDEESLEIGKEKEVEAIELTYEQQADKDLEPEDVEEWGFD